MENNLILVQEYCSSLGIAPEFITELENAGIVKVVIMHNSRYLAEDDTPVVNRVYRLHNDLGVNFEGLDIIEHLLKRQRIMELRMAALNDRLKLINEGFDDAVGQDM